MIKNRSRRKTGQVIRFCDRTTCIASADLPAMCETMLCVIDFYPQWRRASMCIFILKRTRWLRVTMRAFRAKKNVFQRFLRTVLHVLMWTIVYVYLNYVLNMSDQLIFFYCSTCFRSSAAPRLRLRPKFIFTLLILNTNQSVFVLLHICNDCTVSIKLNSYFMSMLEWYRACARYPSVNL